MTGPYDRDQRAAARLQQAHPRLGDRVRPVDPAVFRLPRFQVPPGTIAAAATAGELASLMRVTEMEARPGPRPRAGGSATPHALAAIINTSEPSTTSALGPLTQHDRMWWLAQP